jgi:hypothetical protein
MSEIRCRELVGAYAVGALEPPEAAVLADHLLTCLRCRHVLAEAEETAALLAAVPPEMFLDEPADPNDPLLQRTLHAIRLEAAPGPAAVPPPAHADARRQAMQPMPTPNLRPVGPATPAGAVPAAAGADNGFPGWSGQSARSHRRRPQATTASQQQRKYKLVGAAAAAVLVMGGGVMIGAKLSNSTDSTSGDRTQAASVKTAEPTPSSSQVSQVASARPFKGSNPVTGVNVSVDVTPTDSGVQLTGTIKGLQSGQKCKLAVKDTVGNQTLVTTWTTPKKIPAGGFTFDKVASVPASILAAVEILDQHGQVLATAKA